MRGRPGRRDAGRVLGCAVAIAVLLSGCSGDDAGDGDGEQSGASPSAAGPTGGAATAYPIEPSASPSAAAATSCAGLEASAIPATAGQGYRVQFSNGNGGDQVCSFQSTSGGTFGLSVTFRTVAPNGRTAEARQIERFADREPVGDATKISGGVLSSGDAASYGLDLSALAIAGSGNAFSTYALVAQQLTGDRVVLVQLTSSGATMEELPWQTEAGSKQVAGQLLAWASAAPS